MWSELFDGTVSDEGETTINVSVVANIHDKTHKTVRQTLTVQVSEDARV